MGIAAPLSGHARQRPQATALSLDGDALTWAELDAATGRLAAHLAAAVPAGRGIAFDLPVCPALVLLFLAAARAGREAQVFDAAWPAETVRRVCGHLDPALLATSRPGGDAGVPLLRIDPAIPFAAVAETAGAPADWTPVAEPSASLPFYVGFTSGSTGLPKGYRRTHASWIESFAGEESLGPLAADDVILAPGGFAHSLTVYALARGLYRGVEVVLCRRFNPTALTRLIPDRAVTTVYAVPSQILLLAEAAAHAPGCFSGVRTVLSSGAKWPEAERPRFHAAFAAAELREFYGCSELSFVAMAREGETPPGSVGRAFPGVRIAIRDRAGRRLPPGKRGLVFVESGQRFLGYACGTDTPPLSRAGGLSVGDAGFLDAEGFLYLTGRRNRTIISCGKNIQPEEIEAVLAAHPAVAAAAVLGIADARRGQRLAALVRLRKDGAVTRRDLIAFARQRLPLYKVPRLYAAVGDWPLTSSGKTDLSFLERRWRDGRCEALP